MERIASFCVDHTRLLPGMYLSRQDGADGEILTWDIRMKQPNKGSYLSPAAAHTLEHLFATYARNCKYSRGVVYVGPMGCLTGFYLLTTGLTPAEALDLTRSAFAWMAEYEGEIPGASAVECGNYLMMDPIAARAEAAAMLPVLEGLDAEKLALAAPDAIVMHPGPMNRGVEIDGTIADDINRSVIQDQVEMGVAVRMAAMDLLARNLRAERGARASEMMA